MSHKRGDFMSEVQAIENRIRNLSSQEFSSLREWFHEFENEYWDQQIASYFRGDKFNKLTEKARAELSSKLLWDLPFYIKPISTSHKPYEFES